MTRAFKGVSKTVDIGVARPQLQAELSLATTTDLAFDDFYAANAARIGRALDLTLQHPELAEGALNEAMTRALQKWKQVGGYSNPSGWVYRTAMNWARSWLRRRRRERDRPLHQRPVDPFASVEPGLAAALAALSEDHRAVVVCRFHLDWTTAETADALDVAEGTVKSRLSRAIDQIRTDLGVSLDRTPLEGEGTR